MIGIFAVTFPVIKTQVMLVLLLLNFGCVSDSEALRRYHEAIVAYSGSSVVTESCVMFGNSRVGRCLVRGTPVEIGKLIASLPLDARHDAPPLGPSCADLAAFGTPKSFDFPTLRQFQPGVRFLWRRDSNAGGPQGFPRNQNNVILRAAYLNPEATYTCMEYEYPYS